MSDHLEFLCIKCVGYHVICKEWWFYFFFSYLDFLYFFFFSVVTRTFKIMLNKKGKNGHHCLVPHLRGIVFRFSPLSMIFALCLSCMAFIMLRSVLSVPAFWRIFIINRCWILSKTFHASIEMIIWFLFFNLLMWYITLIDWWILKNPCIPEVNPTWSWCMIFLM